MWCLRLVRTAFMKRVYWLAVALIVGLPLFPTHAQTAQPGERLAISVTKIDRNEHGFLISVEITNLSERTLFLPQASGWLPFRYRPRVNSLDIEQWSDGKTNLPPREQISPLQRTGTFQSGRVETRGETKVGFASLRVKPLPTRFKRSSLPLSTTAIPSVLCGLPISATSFVFH